ncbi:MAG: hypothetical protein V1794_15775 [Candidatus Glassbacteria bacterium]
MRKTTLFCALLLTAFTAGLQADPQGRQWFVELSVGGAATYGPLDMQRFYDPTVSFSAACGLRLNERLSIIPFDFEYLPCKFYRQAYIGNFWDYKDEFFRLYHEEYPEATSILIPAYRFPEDIEAIEPSSNMISLSYTPGVFYNVPAGSLLRLFAGGGPAVFHSRVTLENIISSRESSGPYRRRYDSFVLGRKSRTDFGLWLGCGFDYETSKWVVPTFAIKYSLLFTGTNKSTASVRETDGVLFFQRTGDGLTSSPFMEGKNVRVLHISVGFKFYLTPIQPPKRK